MKHLLLFSIFFVFFTTANAQWGSALSFDGSSQYAATGIFSTITDNFTMEAWVKWAGGTYTQYIVMNGTNGLDQSGYAMAIYADGTPVILLSGLAWLDGTSSKISVGVWTHIAIVNNGGTWSIFVNGTSVLTQIAGSPSTPAEFFSIGVTDSYHRTSDDIGGYFNGVIDEVRFSSVVRYTSNFTPPSTPFTTDANTIALYHFDEGSGTTTADVSGNGYNLGFDSSPTWVVSSLPVELTSFTATTTKSSAMLAWQTATEVNNYGFDVERRTVGETVSGKWEKVGFVAGNGTSNSAHSYSYTDNVITAGTYVYRLKQIDNGGTFKYSSEAQVTVAVPTSFALGQNYPNPFNPTTVINYQLPVTGSVSLKVYDVIGREVATLVNEQKDAGNYQVTFNASNLASGMYFYRLQAGSYTSVKKLVLMK
jgi:hypothetical protein